MEEPAPEAAEVAELAELEDTEDTSAAEDVGDIGDPTSLPPGERWGEPVLPTTPVNEPVEPDLGADHVEDDDVS